MLEVTVKVRGIMIKLQEKSTVIFLTHGGRPAVLISPSRLLLIVNWSVNWFVCVQRRTCTSWSTPPSTERHANPIPWMEADKTNKNWLPRQRPLGDRITNFRSFIYSQCSTNRANVVKICLVHVEITGLTVIVKNKDRIWNESRI